MQEVQAQDWGPFCQRVTENARGGTVTIQKVQSNGARVELANQIAFDRMDFGKRDDCNDSIEIRGAGTESLKHEVVEPIRILLEETPNASTFHSVIIEAEDGITTLNFHPNIKSAWLGGLKVR